MTGRDSVLEAIAEYAAGPDVGGDLAFGTARLCLIDSIGCALLAMNYPACTKLLGPYVDGTRTPGGARVPGTIWELDPVKAAFDIGAAIRWLDFNDTWLAAEWGHPSDNFGGILAAAQFVSRSGDTKPVTVRDVLAAATKAYEIQGVLALDNAFNRVGNRSRAAGQSRFRCGRHGDAWRQQRTDIQRGFERLARSDAAHVPPRAQHRLAQVLGRRRRNEPGSAIGDDGDGRGDGVRHGVVGARMGIRERLVPAGTR